MTRGYFGIGIEHTKTEQNVGTLFRSALVFNADFIFTIGRRYKCQCSDTPKTYKHLPLFHYIDFADFYSHIPVDCRLVGVELSDKSVMLPDYKHQERCIYLLGAEDSGLSKLATSKCHELIQIPGTPCLNVSTAGSIVLYDRISKQGGKTA